MDRPYLCPDCCSEHDEPAIAVLGHLVTCLDCALTHDILSFQETVVTEGLPAIAA